MDSKKSILPAVWLTGAAWWFITVAVVREERGHFFIYDNTFVAQYGLNWLHSRRPTLTTLYSQAGVNRLTYIKVYILMPSHPPEPQHPPTP